MLRKIVLLFMSVVFAPSTFAVCTLARGQPTTLTIPSQMIVISADMVADTSAYIPGAKYDSNALTSSVGFDDCINGTEYGKRPIGLVNQDASTKIYQTNIPGIGVKLMSSNGTAMGGFPQTTTMKLTVGTFDYPVGSYYEIQFFKTSDTVTLKDPVNGDVVLPAGDLAYSYIFAPSLANFTMKLNIGEIRIRSTPACTVDSPTKSIDFNNVTPTLLAAGVVRDLSFGITCKSDYGSYSAKASMTSSTASSDGSYIKVTDAGSDTSTLGIRITDGNNQIVKLDGSTNEQRNPVVANNPADYSWKATLFAPAGATSAPRGGIFNAKAEIIFDIE